MEQQTKHEEKQIEIEQVIQEKLIDSNIHTHKIGGNNRLAIAVSVSKEMYPNGFAADHSHKTVIITTAFDSADALSAGPLSAEYGHAPILLIDPAEVSQNIAEELKRLGAEHALILGGEKAVSLDVETKLESLLPSVQRISGKTRYEMNHRINQQLATINGVFVASATNFADAVSAAPLAAQLNYGIVLTNGSLTDEAKQTILGKNVFILAGTAALADSVLSDIKQAGAANVKRIAGDNRYSTNVALLKEFNLYNSIDGIIAATGSDFPDALTTSSTCRTERPASSASRKFIGYFYW